MMKSSVYSQDYHTVVSLYRKHRFRSSIWISQRGLYARARPIDQKMTSYETRSNAINSLRLI